MRGKIINCFLFLFVFLLGGGTMYFFVQSPYFQSKEATNATGEVNTNDGSTGSVISPTTTGTVIVNNGGLTQSVSKIYNSVVMIENYKNKKLAGTGSGFVYKKDEQYGYIMTNYHVIEDATSVNVLFTNEEKVSAKVLGGDEYLDIAVLRVDAEAIISVSSLGSTEKLLLGDIVFTVGSPVGEEYFNTVTSGIVSGLNRKVTVSVQSTNDWIQEVIQVDAAINPGNSGGPLVNANGEVIGINSLKLVDSTVENMGFAIKIEDAMKHIEDLESGKGIERPLLGIQLYNVSDSRVPVGDGIEYGVVVAAVIEDSGASRSDLEKGDVIIKLNSDKVTNLANLKYLLYKYNVGDTIEVTYIRDGKEAVTKITLTSD